jgi:hypothetical protein
LAGNCLVCPIPAIVRARSCRGAGRSDAGASGRGGSACHATLRRVQRGRGAVGQLA